MKQSISFCGNVWFDDYNINRTELRKIIWISAQKPSLSRREPMQRYKYGFCLHIEQSSNQLPTALILIITNSALWRPLSLAALFLTAHSWAAINNLTIPTVCFVGDNAFSQSVHFSGGIWTHFQLLSCCLVISNVYLWVVMLFLRVYTFQEWLGHLSCS